MSIWRNLRDKAKSKLGSKPKPRAASGRPETAVNMRPGNTKAVVADGSQKNLAKGRPVVASRPAVASNKLKVAGK